MCICKSVHKVRVMEDSTPHTRAGITTFQENQQNTVCT